MSPDEEKIENLKGQAVSKIFATLLTILHEDGSRESKAILSFIGQEGGKLFWRKYGPDINQQVSKISDKIIDYSNVTFHLGHDEHLKKVTDAIADDIFADFAP